MALAHASHGSRSEQVTEVSGSKVSGSKVTSTVTSSTVSMSKARAKALVRELSSVYSAKSFQSKLQEILSKEGHGDGHGEGHGDVGDECPARWAWAEKFHNDILAQYGFPTGQAMKSLTAPLELILQSYPECLSIVQKIAEHLQLKHWPSIESKESKSEVEPVDSKVSLTKNRALALQKELLAIFPTPGFQKKLAEMSRKKPAFKDVICKLFDDGPMEVISRYGFSPSQQGVEEMFEALDHMQDDPDVFVNAFAIDEALLTYDHGPCSVKKVPVSGIHGVRPRTKFTVAKLLRKLLAGFSTPGFQNAIVKLQRKADVEQACSGYYHLRGRAELALPVQRRILPLYGFAASRAGVLEMVLHCTLWVEDDEIAHLWDDINTKLGMTQDACRRFRESAVGLKTRMPEGVSAVSGPMPDIDPEAMRIK